MRMQEGAAKLFTDKFGVSVVVLGKSEVLESERLKLSARRMTSFY